MLITMTVCCSGAKDSFLKHLADSSEKILKDFFEKQGETNQIRSNLFYEVCKRNGFIWLIEVREAWSVSAQ